MYLILLYVYLVLLYNLSHLHYSYYNLLILFSIYTNLIVIYVLSFPKPTPFVTYSDL